MRTTTDKPSILKKLVFLFALAVPLIVLIILMYSIAWSVEEQGAELGGLKPERSAPSE